LPVKAAVQKRVQSNVSVDNDISAIHDVPCTSHYRTEYDIL